jgi:hypothetical protein
MAIVQPDSGDTGSRVHASGQNSKLHQELSRMVRIYGRVDRQIYEEESQRFSSIPCHDWTAIGS